MYLYLIIFSLTSAVVAGLGVAAQRRAGPRGLIATTAAMVPLLLVLGYYRWRAVPSSETPLMAYVLVAIIPTLVAALLVWSARNRSIERQLLLGTIGSYFAIIPSLFLGTYVLADLLPQ